MERLRALALNPDGFAFDPTTGESFTLNATGVAALEGLRDGLTPEQVAQRLTETFEVSPDEATRDVTDFVDHLRAYRLL